MGALAKYCRGQGFFRGRSDRLIFAFGVGASPFHNDLQTALSRLIEVTCTAVPAGAGTGNAKAGRMD
jgi:hypothetical protein